MNGEPLIFVAGQPRSGTTLLQRILGGHPDVLTTSETWLLLHPLNAFREGFTADFDAGLARQAATAFVRDHAGGAAVYWSALGAAYELMYAAALEKAGKVRFLDKTPRYYDVLPELRKLFPAAHVVLMWRDPLAVLSSIYRTWCSEDPRTLGTYALDLTRAPEALLEGATSLGERCHVVRYEDLVLEPRVELQGLCDKLGLSWTDGLQDYDGPRIDRFELGDQERVYQHTHPDRRLTTAWHDLLGDKQLWRFARDYLELLGEKTYEALGYDYEAAQRLLKQHKPSGSLLRTLPLKRVLKK